jgi:peptide/nickel transport system substrate-binding protein
MFNVNMGAPDPELFMRRFVSWEVASKENKWQGRNIPRWRSDAYDDAFRAAESELDPVKRAALLIKLNDIVVQDPVVIPVVYRPLAAAISHKLHATLSGWDNTFWNLKDWYRDA